MGSMANIPTIVTECTILVIGVGDCSSSFAHQVVCVQDTNIIMSA